mmetsp:Transcript_12567/g.50514  ORF Transcript_12567/g.50514 Transcript_12567/m.50514 type:complete len:225 (-) Transcript_12567:172-846(-)
MWDATWGVPPSTSSGATIAATVVATGIAGEEYDWVINKLRGRGFKTLQDRRAEAEDQRKQRLAAWEAEKARRAAAGEAAHQGGDDEKNPKWWTDLKALPGAGGAPGASTKLEDMPDDLLTEEQKEEKKIRAKWGGTLAESVPLSDLKTISERGYIPRSQATCFRCGEKGHWSRDCPLSVRAQLMRRDDDDILSKDRSQLRGRDARMYDKALLDKREKDHYNKFR